jgi:hypothetical protein
MSTNNPGTWIAGRGRRGLDPFLLPTLRRSSRERRFGTSPTTTRGLLSLRPIGILIGRTNTPSERVPICLLVAGRNFIFHTKTYTKKVNEINKESLCIIAIHKKYELRRKITKTSQKNKR